MQVSKHDGDGKRVTLTDAEMTQVKAFGVNRMDRMQAAGTYTPEYAAQRAGTRDLAQAASLSRS